MDMPLVAGLELEGRLAARLTGGLSGIAAQAREVERRAMNTGMKAVNTVVAVMDMPPALGLELESRLAA